MDSRPTPDFADLIARLGAELEARRIPFMLIGGQAVLLHGEPRLTQDVDVTMGVGPDRVQDLLGACDGLRLVPLPDDPRTFARETAGHAVDPATGRVVARRTVEGADMFLMQEGPYIWSRDTSPDGLTVIRIWKRAVNCPASSPHA